MAQDYIWRLSDLKNVEKNGFKVFTTFSCGGGSSMGYKLSGFDVIGNCEIDPKINAMYVKNHHPKYNFLMGVQDFYKLDSIPEELFDIDILDGSPPCSTFSVQGAREKFWGKEKKFKEGQAEQVLSDLFFEFINVVERLKPKVVVAENVKGLIVANAKGYVNLIKKRFDEVGYDTQLFLLNAATMGVPQRRERVFFICRRRDLGMPPIKLEFNEKPILYREFADTEWIPLNPKIRAMQYWNKRIPSDNAVRDTAYRIDKRYTGFACPYIKMNQVPYTLTAGSIMMRFDKPGKISDRDIKIISTFPQDYDFNGNNIVYVCGMSVPPFMMRGVAAAVRDQLLSKLPK